MKRNGSNPQKPIGGENPFARDPITGERKIRLPGPKRPDPPPEPEPDPKPDPVRDPCPVCKAPVDKPHKPDCARALSFRPKPGDRGEDEHGKYTVGDLVRFYDGCKFCDRMKTQQSNFFPPHRPNPTCESGEKPHCTCDGCF